MKLSCILIVDDNDGDQFMCQDLFETESPETTILQAYDGVEALEILEKSEVKPDLIILDINMPRMNGHEFLEVYNRKQSEEKISVIIMLTSSLQEQDKERSMSYSFVIDYFEKPLDGEDITKLKRI